MKRLFYSIISAILMLILVSCYDGNGDDRGDEITVQVYQDDDIKLSHTVGDSGTTLRTVIHAEYGDISDSYTYDEAGDLSLITRSDPLGQVARTQVSTTRFQTRSGKTESVVKTFITDSATRSVTDVETITYNFSYADDDLTEIVKEYGHNCIETKNTEEDAMEMAKMLASGLRRKSSAGSEYSVGTVPDWVKEAEENPDTIKPYFENVELNIRGDVVDFRLNGIRGNIVKGKIVTKNYLDLKVGDVFIDGDEIARKIVSIDEDSKTFKIYTESPDLTDVFYGGRIPRQTVLITAAENVVDGYVLEGSETRSTGTRGFSTSFSQTLWKKDNNSLSMDFSADLGVTVSCDVYLGRPGWFCWHDGYAYAYFHPDMKLNAGFTASFSVDNGESLRIPLYAFDVGIAKLGLYAQPQMEGSLSAYVKSGVEFGGYMGGRCVLDPWPENVCMVNQLKFGFLGEAGLTAEASFKPKVFVYGSVGMCGISVVEIDPGGGFYVDLSGSISGGFKWNNVDGGELYWSSEGSADLGIFLDASVEVADSWRWTIFSWKYSLYKYDAWSTDPDNQKTWKEIPLDGVWVPSYGLTCIDAAPDGTVVAVNNNRPWILNSDRTHWTELSVGADTKIITVGDRNTIYRLDNNGTLYKWNGHSWENRNVRFRHIDTKAGGHLIAVGMDEGFYASGDTGRSWYHGPGAKFRQVALTSRETNYIINDEGHVFIWRGHWDLFMYGQSMTGITGGDNDRLYGLDKYGSVFNITGGMKKYYGVNAKAIAYGNDDNLYVLGKNGKCYHWTYK